MKPRTRKEIGVEDVNELDKPSESNDKLSLVGQIVCLC